MAADWKAIKSQPGQGWLSRWHFGD